MNLKVSILVTACLFLMPITASGAEVRVSIEDIPMMTKAASPFASILDDKLGIAEAEYDISNRWSNPSFIWEMEEVGNGDISLREWVVAVEKKFQLPWYSSKSNAGSDLRVSSARLSYEAARWRLISNMRHGYVTLMLRDTEARLIEDFEKIIGEAGRVIVERKEQGTVSGIEKRLIEMSLLSVRARIITIRAERREIMDEWKTAMGIPAGDTVVLTTEPELDADWLSTAQVTADGSSDVESRRLAAEAFGADTGAEKAAILPSINLTGGYKRVEDEFTGFVVGLSFPLPLLNRNSGGVDRASAKHRKARAETDLYESSRKSRIARLLISAGDAASLLRQYHDDFAEISDHVADLAASYKEGWIDLGDFLEGVQTYSDGMQQYFDILEGYHDIVFELEELTEREIFSPGTARKEETGS